MSADAGWESSGCFSPTHENGLVPTGRRTEGINRNNPLISRFTPIIMPIAQMALAKVGDDGRFADLERVIQRRPDG